MLYELRSTEKSQISKDFFYGSHRMHLFDPLQPHYQIGEIPALHPEGA
jgi:hypothetical protein